MRLTDSHIALTSPSFSRFLFFFLSRSLLLSSSFYFPLAPDFRVANPTADCEGCASLPFRRLILLLPPSTSSRSYASSLSYGPRIPAGLFVTPVFRGILDLELIFVGRKLCRSHPWINFAPSTNHRRTITLLSLSLSHILCAIIVSVHRACIARSFKGRMKIEERILRRRVGNNVIEQNQWTVQTRSTPFQQRLSLYLFVIVIIT